MFFGKGVQVQNMNLRTQIKMILLTTATPSSNTVAITTITTTTTPTKSTTTTTSMTTTTGNTSATTITTEFTSNIY